MKNTVVVNIFGGPGSGKSTLAAGIFYELKKRSLSAELVREYVKKWAWEGILPNRLDQLYITGKQTKAEHMLYGKVDTIVTDCPVLMGVFYDKKYNDLNTVDAAVGLFLSETKTVRRLNFVTKRDKAFDPNGRFCSEESAVKTDAELIEFLNARNIEFVQLDGPPDEQVKQILNALEVMSERD